MSRRLLLLLSLLFLSCPLFSQIKSTEKSFQDIRKNYENLEKEDSRAAVYIDQFIRKAKKEQDFIRLALGYKDAVHYTKDVGQKMAYADSTISAALKTGDPEVISDSYLGKGLVYYFNLRKFKPALNQYLIAHQYAAKTKDEYLKKKVLYHLGVIKSYLGYYDEALDHFEACIHFYETKSTANDVHPNTQYNFKRGYLNSIHQMIICSRNLNKNRAADSLITVGIDRTENSKDFILENAYFMLCRGLSYYDRSEPNEALYYFKKAEPVLKLKNDYARLSVLYMYTGKIFLQSDDQEKGIRKLEKVDSIYNRYHFILPEVRNSYELLINYYQQKKEPSKQLYFTNQLLEVDRTLMDNFTYLYKKLYREFDRAELLLDKSRLEKSLSVQQVAILGITVISVIFIIMYVSRSRREKLLRTQYGLLQLRLAKDTKEYVVSEPEITYDRKNILTKEIAEELKVKFQNFEDKKLYLQKGITLAKLATQFKSNSSYLSAYINASTGMNFSSYISHLRIKYITHLLNTEKKYLNYRVESLAMECGISSRVNFSNLFLNMNGIRPGDFMKLKLKEIEDDGENL